MGWIIGIAVGFVILFWIWQVKLNYNYPIR